MLGREDQLLHQLNEQGARHPEQRLQLLERGAHLPGRGGVPV